MEGLAAGYDGGTNRSGAKTGGNSETAKNKSVFRQFGRWATTAAEPEPDLERISGANSRDLDRPYTMKRLRQVVVLGPTYAPTEATWWVTR